ncbi:MAG: 30S ribosomal protein S12 methylthiotransferase RimO [Betaproteobacteria bacterium]|nr:30S ribosomal protein S12 methylthiotransferase RimO [Betaproteobacteria bacterium]
MNNPTVGKVKQKSTAIPTVGFVSLGCPKALVDSEQILTQLRAEGYQISGSYEGADIVVVNTCGFIDSAIDESLEAIGEALEQNGRVIVTGCLGANQEKIRQVHPGVLAVTGPHDKQAVMSAIHESLPALHDPFVDLLPPHGIKLTPNHYAYLKISEGCNHRCTFCIIPSLRGDLVSRPIHEVMQEAENLVKAGVKELLVISQDTSAYGVDLKYRTGFWQGQPRKTRITELCEALGELGVWVRLHYVYPYPHVDELIPLMAEGKVLPYLDIPLQHANPQILKAMKRPGDIEKTLERIQSWRRLCPELTLRSTFIVGFPGETESQFEDLLSFLKEAQLDRVGCFTYSPVEGASANKIGHFVAEEVKLERQARLMALQQEISEQRLRSWIGKTRQVIVDEIEDDWVIARSQSDAPEIDGLVFIHPHQELKVGQLTQVVIEDTKEHDCIARKI